MIWVLSCQFWEILIVIAAYCHNISSIMLHKEKVKLEEEYREKGEKIKDRLIEEGGGIFKLACQQCTPKQRKHSFKSSGI